MQLAIEVLKNGGDAYVKQQVEGLEGHRAAVLDSLSPLGQLGDGNIFGGEGAIYFWAKLPRGCEDRDIEVVAWLIKQHGVCVLPGSSCGSPGYVRVAFANLPIDKCREAAGRLKQGLIELVAMNGVLVLDD